MKTLLLALSVMFVSTAVFSQTKADDLVSFKEKVYDFGKIKQGTPVTVYFEIKNVSDKPIVVENSWASCGCTTPEKITEPIMPGAATKLKVDYNAAAMGPFTKDVYIKIAGIEQPKSVQIVGEVVAKEAYDQYVKEQEKAKADAAAAAAAAKKSSKNSKTKTTGQN